MGDEGGGLATQPWYGSGIVYTKSDLFDLRLTCGKEVMGVLSILLLLYRLTSLSCSLCRVSSKKLTLIRPRDLNLNLLSSCITRVHFTSSQVFAE